MPIHINVLNFSDCSSVSSHHLHTHTISFFVFFNDTATTEIYTLSLHDALPIWVPAPPGETNRSRRAHGCRGRARPGSIDRKSTRLNSSHLGISYAVFCLKKKKKIDNNIINK